MNLRELYSSRILGVCWTTWPSSSFLRWRASELLHLARLQPLTLLKVPGQHVCRFGLNDESLWLSSYTAAFVVSNLPLQVLAT